MNTNGFLRLVRKVQVQMISAYKVDGTYLPNAPQMILASGLRMSVQASAYHYCLPRENNAREYTEVEVGFPSEEIPELVPYAEDADNPTNTVYPYVPVSVLDAVIKQNGGIIG